MFRLIAAYVLGAFTFWPPIGLALYFGYKFFGRRRIHRLHRSHNLPPGSKPDEAAKQFAKPIGSTQDTSSRVEAACTIRISPVYFPPRKDISISVDTSSSVGRDRPFDKIRKQDPTTKDEAKHNETKPDSELKSGFQKIVNAPSTLLQALTKKGKLSGISDCLSYYAVVRGGQLQLFVDEGDAEPVYVVVVPKYLVMIWPAGLKESHLYLQKYPIALIDRADPLGVPALEKMVAKNGRNGSADTELAFPKAALYIYVDNPVQKEDLYFALIRESQYTNYALKPGSVSDYANVDLGTRDPSIMARPLRAKKQEIKLLQNSVWGNQSSENMAWFNAMIGRLFLGLKDSDWALKYAIRTLAKKLDSISRSNDIIGKVEILEIYTGAAAPVFSNVKLKELTSEGQIHVASQVSYTGGFKVRIAAKVKLAAVSTITAVEIPVELVACLKSFNGTVMLLIKPPPSERVWYCFEAMPDIDLDVEPAIYDTQISLSMATNYLKTKIIDGVRSSLVFPYMQDIAFFDTHDQFYRGGVWRTPEMESLKPDSEMKKEVFVNHKEEARKQKEKKEEDRLTVRRRSSRASSMGSATSTLRKLKGDSETKESTHSRNNSASSESPVFAPLKSSFSGNDLDRVISNTSKVTVVEGVSKIRKFGSWLKKHAIPEPLKMEEPFEPVETLPENLPAPARSPLKPSWGESTTKMTPATAQASYSSNDDSDANSDIDDSARLLPPKRTETSSVHSEDGVEVTSDGDDDDRTYKPHTEVPGIEEAEEETMHGAPEVPPTSVENSSVEDADNETSKKASNKILHEPPPRPQYLDTPPSQTTSRSRSGSRDTNQYLSPQVPSNATDDGRSSSVSSPKSWQSGLAIPCDQSIRSAHSSDSKSSHRSRRYVALANVAPEHQTK